MSEPATLHEWEAKGHRFTLIPVGYGVDYYISPLGRGASCLDAGDLELVLLHELARLAARVRELEGELVAVRKGHRAVIEEL